VWDGVRILPRAVVDYGHHGVDRRPETPAPTAAHWLGVRGETLDTPTLGTFRASGYQGQQSDLPRNSTDGGATRKDAHEREDFSSVREPAYGAEPSRRS